MDKNDVKACLKFKFRTWKRSFAVFFAVFIISFITGTILYKGAHLEFLSSVFGYFINAFDKGFTASLSVLLLHLIPFFILFVAGPTIYAPSASFITVCLTGLFNGAQASYIMRRGRIALAMFETVFSSAVSYLLILWAIMTTLSSIRLFTDVKKEDAPELFTGSMFCTAGFRKTFNYRYILSYIGFYIFMSLGASVLTLLRALAATLF